MIEFEPDTIGLEPRPDTDADETAPTDTADTTKSVVDAEQMEAHLQTGEIEILGRMPWSSNGTFLCTITNGDARCRAIYKPEVGEKPLWDFPEGLWRREVATYELARALDWPVIPPTVERDGPLDVGSLQLFIDARFEEHYFTFKDEPDLADQLRQLCVLDLVANNTDRKSGHVLLTESRRCWGIDHGLNFHEEFKLRTVIWDFAGTPIDSTMIERLIDFIAEPLPERLTRLLSDEEIEALRDRTNAAIAGGHFPHDPTGRRYPWPLV